MEESGTREELVERLRNIAVGCMGSEPLRLDALDGIDALESGGSSVRVGHAVYTVTDR